MHFQKGFRVVIIRTCGAALLLFGVASAVAAQQPAPQGPVPGAATVDKVPLTAGRSTVLMTDFDITRVAVTDPAVADATVVEPREVLVDGKMPGTVSLIIWGAAERRQYDIVVEPGVSTLEQRLQALFPGEDIRITATGDAVILSGRVSSNDVSLRAAEIATATASKAKVVNLLQLPGGSGSQQVLLKVRFAEVSRRALTEIGASLFTSATGINNTIGRATTTQFAAPSYNNLQASKASSSFGADVSNASGEITFSDFLNIFLFSQKYDLGAMIKALRGRGLFQSLAEPNLIAYNGQEASFLAGGEVPIPSVQGASGAVSVTYKEYGIRLNFTPTVAGDTIRLHVRPEVSTLDFPNGILLSGFRIPALATRRGETDVELLGVEAEVRGLVLDLQEIDVAVLGHS